MSSLPPAKFFVTASSQKDIISYDGRAANSSVWRGGAAYVQMCLTCGLEPVKAGRASNCLCMCGLGKRGAGCSRVLSGLGDEDGKCSTCGGGRPEIPSIGTVEVKAKRPRSSYLSWAARPCPTPNVTGPALDAVGIVAVVADAAIVTDVPAGVRVPIPAIVTDVPFSYSV
jgi:hypothetical protein